MYPPKRGRYWEIHPRSPRDFLTPERFPEGEARGKSRGSREISRAEGMDFPIPPSFWWSTNTIPCIKVKKLKFYVPTTAQRVNRFHKRSFLVKIECICLKGLLTYYVSQIRGFSHTPRQQWSGIPSGLPTSGLPTGRQS